MKRTDFSYELPPELIAQHPPAQRGDSRLLVLDRETGECAHRVFGDLPDLLEPNDLLVFNDTRVIPARLFGHKDTGGKVEVLLERLTSASTATAHIRSSKSPKPGTVIHLDGDPEAGVSGDTLTVEGREGALFQLRTETGTPLANILTRIGHMPLPPYIEREDEHTDWERYQTVYARKEGAVAAPTAGLHFTDELLAAIDARGIQRTAVTLHVGAGTFQPVRVDDIEAHEMHTEYLEVSAEVCSAVRATRERGGRVVAVGTTAVRSLETAAQASGEVQPFTGDTDIFIYPGYQFRAVDAMITNFHLPESTLLMLVSAFASHGHIMAAYQQAIDRAYRFFSYGDAMLITRESSPSPFQSPPTAEGTLS